MDTFKQYVGVCSRKMIFKRPGNSKLIPKEKLGEEYTSIVEENNNKNNRMSL